MKEIYEDLEVFAEACKEAGAKRIFVSTRGDEAGKNFLISCTAKGSEAVLIFQELVKAEEFMARHDAIAKALAGKSKAILIAGTLAD